MVKVKITRGVYVRGVARAEGEIVEVTPQQAAEMVASNQATPVKADEVAALEKAPARDAHDANVEKRK